MWKGVSNNYEKTNTVYLADFPGFNGEKTIDALFKDAYVNEIQQFIKKE
ncbi:MULTISPECIES: hypothetical protein [Flavobacterium]|uniref:Uncharacterized protein n=2 Tax=Flavobacterium chungangense TaxID=554283 RepID=A0A6V6YZK7_9FLAO|nr:MULTISPECIES: hypothetical protein [Flavobacterium]CAD0004836.1 hypothetical protein FLACHUCJ7_02054 [Flavobacterium chungangense]